MKKISFLFLFLLLAASSMYAQAPKKMSFQAVIRNGTNALVTNSAVGMRISIIQGSPSGLAVYIEKQAPMSNANGLISLEIGTGSIITGDFSTIDWSAGPYYIQTESDPTGGTDYTITGTQELLSVPYALYAEKCAGVEEPTYSIGYNADQGGYIFYVTPDGKHGLVCATQDQLSVSIYYAQESVSNPTYHDAAGKKFTDWRIPTNYEIQLIYPLRTAIGGFVSGAYWSSVRASETDNWFCSFVTGGMSTTPNISSLNIRAVRSF